MTKTKITAAKLANTDQAVRDLRLTDMDYRLLGLMVSLADGQTGVAKRHTQVELAKLLGRKRRSVQRCLDRLVEFRYVAPVGEARKGIVRAYNVLKAQDATSGSHVALKLSDQPEMRPQGRLDATLGSQRCDPSFAHSYPSLSPSISPSAANSNIDPGAPRLRAGALGAPSMEGKGLANGNAAAPAKPHPLGELEPGLRAILGEDFRRLAMVKLEARTADTVALSVLTESKRAEVRQYCEAAILKVSGASKLEFVFAMPVQPPMLRRMP